MNMTTTISHKDRSFTVNDSKGQLKKGILNCFMARILLDTSNPPATIRANNGKIYQTVYDNLIPPSGNDNRIIEVIASFQQWDDGNFVVIRNLSAQKLNKGEA